MTDRTKTLFGFPACIEDLLIRILRVFPNGKFDPSPGTQMSYLPERHFRACKTTKKFCFYCSLGRNIDFLGDFFRKCCHTAAARFSILLRPPTAGEHHANQQQRISQRFTERRQ